MELYREAGIRSVEVGTVMFGRRDAETGVEIPGPMELVRVAIPRLVYTQSHLDYMLEALLTLWKRRGAVSGYSWWRRRRCCGTSRRASPPFPAPPRPERADHPVEAGTSATYVSSRTGRKPRWR